MTEDEIRPYIKSKIFGNKIYGYDVIDSTNTRAKLFLQQGTKEGTVVIADEQTSGRGRINRVWISEPQKNLTFSLLIKPTISPERIGVLSIYAGLAVAEAVRNITKVTPTCKWPNDVQLKGKKFCGILSESVFNNSRLAGVVIGIGINVNQSKFPKEIESIATSLYLVTGEEYNRYEVLNAVLEQLELHYATIKSGLLTTILDSWKNYTSMFGKEVSISQDRIYTKGVAKRLDDDGGLIVLTTNGETKVLAGDVTLC